LREFLKVLGGLADRDIWSETFEARTPELEDGRKDKAATPTLD
jgi:hypothetical protein